MTKLSATVMKEHFSLPYSSYFVNCETVDPRVGAGDNQEEDTKYRRVALATVQKALHLQVMFNPTRHSHHFSNDSP